MQKMQGAVDKVYNQVRVMATNFEFKPSERINEGALADLLGTSRTPLREALNRLVAEGFLNFQNGRGFSCRSLDPKKIMDLYEARQAIECEALRLAATRARDQDIAATFTFLDESEHIYTTGSSSQVLTELDEEFHLRLVRMSGNQELERILTNLNARIHFVRQIDMGERCLVTPAAHLKILEALKGRDEAGAVAEMRDHIGRRSEEATEAVKQAFTKIYVPNVIDQM